MKSKLLKSLKLLIPIGLGVFLIFYAYGQFTETQLLEIKSYLVNANYFYLGLSVIFALISHISRAYRWNYLLTPMGYKIDFWNSFLAVMIAYLVNLLFPRTGEVTRAAIAKKYDDIPFQKAMGTIVTERLLDLIILVSLSLLAVIIQFDKLGSYLKTLSIPTSSWISLLSLSICIVLVFIFLKRNNHPFIRKIKDFLNGFKEGLFSLFKVKKLGWFLFHTFLIWGMYILMFYVSIFALEETSDIEAGAVISSFVMGGIAIAFTNGGFGAYPFLIASMLLLYDVPFTVGTAFGWIVWLMQFVLIVVFGGISLLILPFYNQMKTSKQQNSS